MEKTIELTWDGILLRLKEFGVKYVYAYYSGGGDSGAIDTWKFFGNEEGLSFDVEDECFSGFDDAEVLNLSTHEMSHLESLVKDEFYSVLNDVEDWWNNDGGWGEMVLEVDTGRYLIDNNCYITTTETYSHSGKFDSHI